MRNPFSRIGGSGREGGERLRYIATALVVVFLVAVIFIVKNAIDRHTYSSYQVIREEKKTDNVASYEYVDGNALRYSTDGAALLKTDFTTIWNESYNYSNPCVDISGSEILIYDRQSTGISIYSSTGKVASFETDLPILKACISEKDTVAAILDNGKTIDFAYYTKGGSKLASGQTTISDPGYPADLSLSPNGENLAISYMKVADGSLGSVIEFYNFGSAGKNKKNNMTASDTIEDAFVPEISWLSDSVCTAFRDDGFTVYRGGSSPKVSKKVDFDSEIVSVFHDASHIGVVFSGGKSSRYKLAIYSTGGSLNATADVDLLYTDARVCGDQIIFYNSTNFSVYSMKGFCRFSGKLKAGNIGDILKVGDNRYMVMTDEKMELIRLK